MDKVFVLQHSYEINGYDETKFIGVYSTNQKAKEAIKRLKLLPGFSDRPKDFHIDEYEINRDYWTEGYSTMVNIHVKRKDNSWTITQSSYFPNNTYQIIEFYDAESLGEFKHLDIVECEEINGELYATKLVTRHKNQENEKKIQQ